MGLFREGVEKCWSLPVFGNKVNVASKLVYDQFRNDKSKTNAVSVEFLFLILDGAKQLKQLVLILVPDANAVINHRQPQELVGAILHNYYDLTVTVCEFNRVWEKV